MKKVTAWLMSFILFFSFAPMTSSQAKGNTSVKGIKWLKQGVTYQYDLDGDGKKEKIYYKNVYDKESVEVKSTKVYLNGKCIYSKVKGCDFFLAVMNVNVKDSYVELVLAHDIEDNVDGDIKVLRYKKGKYNTMFHLETEMKKMEQKNYRLFYETTSRNWKVKGNGIIEEMNDINFYHTKIGQLRYKLKLKEKNGKLEYVMQKTFPVATNKGKWTPKYNYKAGKEMKVYKSNSLKSKTAFYIAEDQYFLIDKFTVTSIASALDKPIFVHIKAMKGKSGWIYISSQSDYNVDFTGKETVQLPAWR